MILSTSLQCHLALVIRKKKPTWWCLCGVGDHYSADGPLSWEQIDIHVNGVRLFSVQTLLPWCSRLPSTMHPVKFKLQKPNGLNKIITFDKRPPWDTLARRVPEIHWIESGGGHMIDKERTLRFDQLEDYNRHSLQHMLWCQSSFTWRLTASLNMYSLSLLKNARSCHWSLWSGSALLDIPSMAERDLFRAPKVP
jgi:hypothetical protein